MPGGYLDARVGETVRSTAAARRVACDAALFLPESELRLHNEIVFRGERFRELRGIRTIDRDGGPFIVHKLGQRTHLSTGILQPDEVTAVLEDGGSRTTATYECGFVINGDKLPFAAGGDSGAAVFDDDGYIVGLLAGILSPLSPGGLDSLDPVRAYCLPIDAIFDELQIDLVL